MDFRKQQGSDARGQFSQSSACGSVPRRAPTAPPASARLPARRSAPRRWPGSRRTTAWSSSRPSLRCPGTRPPRAPRASTAGGTRRGGALRPAAPLRRKRQALEPRGGMARATADTVAAPVAVAQRLTRSEAPRPQIVLPGYVQAELLNQNAPKNGPRPALPPTPAGAPPLHASSDAAPPARPPPQARCSLS